MHDTSVSLWPVLLAVASFYVTQPLARAEDFCAVTLNVTESDGTPITSTWIELLGPDGEVELRKMMIGSTLKICDFGFGTHTLRVGTNECLPVAISNLRLVIGSPLNLDVKLNSCGYRDMVRNACLLYLRAQVDGKPLPGAKITPLAVKTDAYGRHQGLFTGTLNLTISMDGFEPATATAQCRHEEQVDVSIVMRKTPPHL